MTREQKLALKKEIETKYADILADENHPLFDDVRAAMLAPEFEQESINWHPVVTVNDDSPAKADRYFQNGICSICGETAATCECHQ
jgi:hypothetical protein